MPTAVAVEPPQASAAPEPRRAQRLEELFIWKLSDELKLSPAEEKRFSDLVRELNTQKAERHQKMDDDLKKFQSAIGEKDRAAAFNEYRKSLQSYQATSVDEIDRVKTLLGLERLAKYVEVKQDLASKVKSLLLDRSDKKEEPAKPLPPPKIIEQ